MFSTITERLADQRMFLDPQEDIIIIIQIPQITYKIKEVKGQILDWNHC